MEATYYRISLRRYRALRRAILADIRAYRGRGKEWNDDLRRDLANLRANPRHTI